MPQNCVIYVRVSTAEQAKPGHHSLQAQQNLCERYAQSNQLKVVEVLRDEGYSGRTSNRPGFRRLIEYTGSQPPTPIKTILIQDTSRMGRDVTEYLLFRQQLQKRGITLIAVAQPNIDSSPEGRLIDTIVAGINQYQSEEKGRRVAIALQKKFDEGVWPGWAPLGYQHVERDGKRMVVPDADSFPLVKLAFERYATGRYAQYRLCKILAEKGLRNRCGRAITRTTLNDMLANPFYFGLMRWNGQEKIGRHEPACDKLTWEQCQRVTAWRNRYASRTRKHEFLLTGLTVCAECERPHTHSVVAKRNKRYYHCNSRSKCPQPYVPAEEIDEQVSEVIRGIHLTDEFIERVVEKVREVFTEKWQNHDAERQTLLRRQNKLEQKRVLLEEKVLSGILPESAFGRHLPQIEQELTILQTQLAQLEDTRQDKSEQLQKLLLFARDIPNAYDKAPDTLKRQYIEFFFKKLVVKDKQIVEPVLTDFFDVLLEGGNVRSTSNLLPGSDVIRTLVDLLERNLLPRIQEMQKLPA